MSKVYLDEYTNKILTNIYANQNLCKLLLIDDNNNPTGYPDILDTKILFTDKTNRRIFTTHFNIDILTDQKSTLTINISDAKLDYNNVFYKDIKVEFFVICPYLLWELNSGVSGVSNLRPNAIISELSNMFVRQPTIGIGKEVFASLQKISPTENVGGYRMCLTAKDFVLNG